MYWKIPWNSRVNWKGNCRGIRAEIAGISDKNCVGIPYEFVWEFKKEFDVI